MAIFVIEINLAFTVHLCTVKYIFLSAANHNMHLNSCTFFARKWLNDAKRMSISVIRSFAFSVILESSKNSLSANDSEVKDC